eukprot:scaffold184313_cov23-Tisochrysis_lutea.AAC.1
MFRLRICPASARPDHGRSRRQALSLKCPHSLLWTKKSRVAKRLGCLRLSSFKVPIQTTKALAHLVE